MLTNYVQKYKHHYERIEKRIRQETEGLKKAIMKENSEVIKSHAYLVGSQEGAIQIRRDTKREAKWEALKLITSTTELKSATLNTKKLVKHDPDKNFCLIRRNAMIPDPWAKLINFWDKLELFEKKEILMNLNRTPWKDVDSMISFHHIKMNFFQKLILKEVSLMMDYLDRNKIELKELPLTVTKEEEINELNMTQTYSQLYCVICRIYDCQVHGIREEKMKILVELDEKGITYTNVERLNFFLSFMNFSKNFNIMDLTEKAKFKKEHLSFKNCSETCFSDFTKLNENVRKKASQLSPLQISTIKLAIAIYGFDPCQISKTMPTLLKCNEVFFYLFFGGGKVQIENYAKGIIQFEEVQKKTIIPNTNEEIQHENGYFPCNCPSTSDGPNCRMNPLCSCFRRAACEKFCLCNPSTCGNRRPGCSCVGICIDKRCACFLSLSECDPDKCKKCFKEKSGCRNNKLLLEQQALKTMVGRSQVCEGLGLYSTHLIEDKTFILEYKGEILSDDDFDLIEKLAISANFYSFGIPSGVIEASFLGNKARFINHSRSNPNCEPKIMFSNGVYRIGIYSRGAIKANTELLMDYGSSLSNKFNWIDIDNLNNYPVVIDTNDAEKHNIRKYFPANQGFLKRHQSLD